MKKVSVSLAVLAACVWLVACGSSGGDTTAEAVSPAQYKHFLTQVSKHEDEAHKAVEESFQTKSVEGLVKALTAFAEDQEARADELSSTTPPENAQSAQTHLEEAFNSTAAAIHELLPEVEEAGSAKEALAALQKSKGPQKAGQDLESAIAELKKLGYTSGS